MASKLTNFGAIAANKTVSPFSVFMLASYDWSMFSHEFVKLERNLKKYDRFVDKHNITQMEKTQQHINESFETEDEYGYKFAYRDLVLFRMSIMQLKMLFKMLSQHYAEDRKAFEQVAAKIQDKGTADSLRELVVEEGGYEAVVAKRVAALMDEVHDELKGERQAIMNFYSVGEGGKGLGLITKKTPKGFLRFLQIRIGSLSALRRNVSGEESEAGDIQKEFQKSKRLRKQLVRSVGDSKRLGKLQHLIALEKRNERSIATHFKKLFDDFENVIRASYKIFIFDVLMLRAVVHYLEEGTERDEQLIAKHFIPKMMGEQDIEKKQAIKERLRTHVDNLSTFVLQLLGTESEVRSAYQDMSRKGNRFKAEVTGIPSPSVKSDAA